MNNFIFMSNSFTQIHIQYVFAVKYRASLIHASWKDELHKFITGICRENGHKMLQLNSMPDHIHIFLGMRPTQSISSLIQNIKSGSSNWINDRKFCPAPFAWQDGYGAFSYSKNQVPEVIRYIQNQEIHHRKETFLNEYERLLKTFEIDYDARYIFTEPI